MMFVSPIFLNIALNEGIKEKVKIISKLFILTCNQVAAYFICLRFQATLWEVMGLRKPGIIPATILPLVLTMVLFLGPISMQASSGIWKLYSRMYKF